jgi:hypothetical protein
MLEIHSKNSKKENDVEMRTTISSHCPCNIDVYGTTFKVALMD